MGWFDSIFTAPGDALANAATDPNALTGDPVKDSFILFAEWSALNQHLSISGGGPNNRATALDPITGQEIDTDAIYYRDQHLPDSEKTYRAAAAAAAGESDQVRLSYVLFADWERAHNYTVPLAGSAYDPVTKQYVNPDAITYRDGQVAHPGPATGGVDTVSIMRYLPLIGAGVIALMIWKGQKK